MDTRANEVILKDVVL